VSGLICFPQPTVAMRRNRWPSLFPLILFAAVRAAVNATAQGYSPDEAPKHMTLPAGLQVQLVASEPMIAQPVCIEFDDRGRLWVIQYLQYPNPAGLKRAVVDRWSRTTYDHVPDRPRAGQRAPTGSRFWRTPMAMVAPTRLAIL